MQKTPANLEYNWNYLNMLTTVINAYISVEQYALARQYCQKALTIEPEFDWVKHKLCPLIIKNETHE